MADSGWRTFTRFAAALTSIVVLAGTTHAAQAAHTATAPTARGAAPAAPAAASVALSAEERAATSAATLTSAVLTAAAAAPVTVTAKAPSEAQAHQKKLGCPCLAIPLVLGGAAEILAAATAITVVAGVSIYVTETVKVGDWKIPAPKKSRKKEKARKHAVYAILYRKKDPSDTHRYVWKYGITGQKDLTARPKSQLASCRKRSKSPFNCTYQFRAKKANWYTARLMEQNLIYVYTKKYGKCPPGHRNAKKVCL